MATCLRPVALTLVALLALAGCTDPRAGLVVNPVAPAPATPLASATLAQPLPAPVVRVEPGRAPAAPAAPAATQPVGYLNVLGHTELTREELRSDAEDSGYRVQASISVPSVKGYLRRSSGTSYLLEASHNHLGVKTPTPTTYTLKTPDNTIRLWLAGHVNEKIHVKGLFAADNSVTVTFADKALDLGFLTNWWTKGKVRGTILGADGLPLVNVEVKARSSAGYVFLGNTDDTGAFSVKNLAPGDYQIWLSKVGYGVVTRLIEIKAHQSTNVEGKLYKN